MPDSIRPHQFKPGGPGGPGRPKGARSRLGEAFLNAVLADFEANGVSAIKKVREEDPSTYMRVIAGILPKELTGENGEPLMSGIQVTFVKPEAK